MIDPLQDGKSFIELIDHMGGDLAVVNDARASRAVVSEDLTPGDIKLMSFLLLNLTSPQHTSPLRGTAFKFRVKAPLYVCRQWWKHHIASSHIDEQSQWNERSLRYSKVKDGGDYYVPKEFNTQSTTNKQSSAGALSIDSQEYLRGIFDSTAESCWDAYQSLIKAGVSREQARGVLPPCFYTTFTWTVSLQAALNFIDLREGHGAQNEITAYAMALEDLISPLVPNVLYMWKARKKLIHELLDGLEPKLRDWVMISLHSLSLSKHSSPGQ